MTTDDLMAELQSRVTSYFAVPAFVQGVRQALRAAPVNTATAATQRALDQLQATYTDTRDDVAQGLAIIATSQQTGTLPGLDQLPALVRAAAGIVDVTDQAQALHAATGPLPVSSGLTQLTAALKRWAPWLLAAAALWAITRPRRAQRQWD